ncbi:MAG: calcium-binding protein [Hyphomicrobiaceae bacterium]|nr:calcium-binding protein [Hyphomicrobiaceae bacterium]
MTVTGAGSEIRLTSNGNAGVGAGIRVGGPSGTGVLSVLSGAVLRINDSLGPANSEASGGTEYVNVARGAGSTGTMNVTGGSVVVNGINAAMNVGRDGGTGTLNLTGGSTFDLNSNGTGASDGTYVHVGRGTGANGTVTIDASSLNIRAGSNADVAMSIGRDGGTGSFSVVNGGFATIIGSANGTGVFLQVGRGTGGNGTLLVDDSTVLVAALTGGNANVQVGSGGGTGTLTLQNDAYMQINGSGEAVGKNVGMNVGFGSTGTLNINSSGLLAIEDINGADFINGDSEFFNIGSNLGGNGTLNMNDGTVRVFGSGVYASIGYNGGIGTAVLASGSSMALETYSQGANEFTSLDIGVVASATGSLTVSGNSTVTVDAGTGQGANINVGSDGTGTLTLTTGSDVLVEASAASATAHVAFGDQGGTGTLAMSGVGTTFTLSSTNASTFAAFGQNGGTGTLGIQSGAAFVMNSSSNSSMNFGWNIGAVGNLTVAGIGSSLSINSSAYVSLNAGLDNGSAALVFEDNATGSLNGVLNAGIEAGRNGGVGTIDIRTGAVVVQQSSDPSGGAWTQLGMSGGTGTINLSQGGILRLIGPSGSGFNIGGTFGEAALDSGTGAINVATGARIEMGSPVFSNLYVGRGAGSSATVTVSSGGVIDMGYGTAPDNGYIRIGGSSATSSGSVSIDGPSSRIEGLNHIIVGRDPFDPGMTGTAAGRLALTNGGSVTGTALNVVIGDGGTLEVGTGLIGGSVQFRDNATVDLQDGAIGVLTINAGVNADVGTHTIAVDYGAIGADRIVADSLSGNGGINYVMNAIGGFKYVTGTIHTLLEFNTLAGYSGEFNTTLIGQHADFGYVIGFFDVAPASLVLEALNSGTTGGHAIFDFGQFAGDAANLEYDATVQQGSAFGGRMTSPNGGSLYRVDEFRGTELADNLQVVDASIDDVDLTINGRGGADYIVTGFGDDTLIGGNDADTMEGGSGNDTYDVDDALDSVIDTAGVDTVRSSIDYILDMSIENLTLIGIYSINGTGTAGANVLTGNDADNVLVGLGGSDTFIAGAGDDIMVGGAANDSFDGGADDDAIDYSVAAAGVTVNLSVAIEQNTGGGGLDTIQNVEGIAGSLHADLLIGNGAVNAIFAQDGNDTVVGGAGADNLDGGADVDTLSYAGAIAGVTANLTTGIGSGGDADGDTFANFENIVGGNGDDVLTGDDNANTLQGGNGNDTLAGGIGNDTLDGGIGIDTLSYASSVAAVSINLGSGTASGDALGDVFAGFENAIGGAGADRLFGSTLANSLDGGDGIDSIVGGSGNDILVGAAGNDTMSGGNDNDTLVGGSGADSMDGGTGEDTLSYAGSVLGVTINLGSNSALAGDAAGDIIVNFEHLAGGQGNDRLLGSTLANTIDGGAGNDSIVGGSGNDVLRGDAGIDTLLGGNDNDTLFGGLDGDTLNGDAGNDTLNGDDGADTLAGGAGADTMDGGTGIDTLSYATSTLAVSINLGTGSATGDALGDVISNFENVIGGTAADRLLGSTLANSLNGGAGNDSLVGGSGDDTLVGDAGIDTLSGGNDNDILIGGSSGDSMDGGAGIDTLSYLGSSGGVVVNLLAGTATGGDATGDIIVSFENVTGGLGVDQLTGNTLANILDGGAGNDTLNGGDGNDTLIGGGGGDTMDGGAGIDTLSYATSLTGISVNLGSGGVSGTDALGDVFANIENLVGTQAGDRLLGSTAANSLNGGAGNDSLVGGSGNDTLSGDAGIDTLVGGNDNDTLYGGGDGDTLYGDAGTDKLYGEDGDDLLAGGASGDTIDGGNGIDTISYATSTLAVTINLGSGSVSGGDAAGDVLSNLENAIGSAYADRLLGSIGANSLNGGQGNDSLIGGSGADILVGDTGTDTLQGGNDNDTLIGGANGDSMDGGTGIDTLSYAGSTVAVTVNLATNTASGGDAAGDLIVNFENLIGGTGNDTLTGNTGANLLDGGAGNDTLAGGTGADSFVFATGYGVDLVTDFANDIDTILLDDALWGGTPLSVAQVLATYATDVGANAVLNFGGGLTLTINNATVAQLQDDVGIF